MSNPWEQLTDYREECQVCSKVVCKCNSMPTIPLTPEIEEILKEACPEDYKNGIFVIHGMITHPLDLSLGCETCDRVKKEWKEHGEEYVNKMMADLKAEGL